MFDADLIRKINLRRCFVLVGSGPSSEIGYPNWHDFTSRIWTEVLQFKVDADQESFDKFLKQRDYPSALRHAEFEFGSREKLVAAAEKSLTRTNRDVPHPIYEYLAKWPFACYLTTNYDDEIFRYLKTIGCHFQTLSNSVEDLAHLRDGVEGLIVKLHADFSTPSRVVLTSLDYDQLITSPANDPFRARVRQIFETFNILVVGHSMTDPDLQLISTSAQIN